MCWTLYKYILRDLIKLLVLSSAVLVVIISFAVAIKPLADGLLGPITLIKFVIYTIPTVLGFALPFAGAFASTLVFSRLALDNEITACRASGISYLKIFAPPLVLGIALTITMFFLANFIVPTFYRWAAQTAQADVMNALVGQIDQQRTFVLKNQGIAIYADSAKIKPAPHIKNASIQPDKLVRLKGVAAVKLAANGSHQREVTAQKANIFIFNRAHNSWITIRLINVQFYDPQRGMFDGGFSQNAALGPFKLPKPFSNSPKFLSLPQLREVRQNPSLNDDVKKRMDALEQALINVKLTARIAKTINSASSSANAHTIKLKEQTRNIYYDLTGHKAIVKNSKNISLKSIGNRSVQIVRHIPNQPTRIYKAKSGTLAIANSGFSNQPLLQIELDDVQVIQVKAGKNITTHANQITLPSMIMPHPVTLDTPNLISAAAASKSQAVKYAATALEKQLKLLARGITAQINVRAASALACLLLIIMGAVMASWLVGQMPLVVYMWTFITAIVTILIINTGRHMTTGGEYPVPVALFVMWLGNFLLALVVGGLYWRLKRQ